jgi:hypothetical protein
MRKKPQPDLERERYEKGDLQLEREYGYLDDQYIHSNAVLHKAQTVFMLIPKAAATSIQYAADLTQTTAEWRSKAYVLHEVPNYYKIAFVRNPLDRLVSCWRSMVYMKLHRTFHLFGIRPQMPWPEFVRVVAGVEDWHADKHFRGQSWSLMTDDGRLIPDFVGNVENIDHDWKMVQTFMRCTKREVGKIRHANVSRGPVPQYDSEILRLASQRYADDLRQFYHEPKGTTDGHVPHRR